MTSRLLSALIALAFVQQAGATLVTQGTDIVDTGTGLEWLNLGQSLGYTFDQVSSQFATGGKFEGYRYATAAEVQAVFVEFGIPLTTPAEYNGKAAVPVAAGIVAFENLFAAPNTSFFDGLVADTVPGDPDSHQLFFGSGTGSDVAPENAHASIFSSFPTDPTTYAANVYEGAYDIAVGKDQRLAYANSSFLVKEVPAVAAVPEPTTSALTLLGLAMLTVGVRRRQAAAGRTGL